MRQIRRELQFLIWCSCVVSVFTSSYSQWVIQRKPTTLVRMFNMFQQAGSCYNVKEIKINCTAIVEITNTDKMRSNNNYRLVYTTCSYFVCGKDNPLIDDPLWYKPLPNSPIECNNGGYVRYMTGDDSLSCICPENFKGRYCDIRIYELPLSNFYIPAVCGEGCHHGGTCVQHYVSTKCLCPDGFTGEFCETELKLTSCNLTKISRLNTSASLTTCEKHYDCKTWETCCRVEDKNVCILQNTSKQVCIYFGKNYSSGEKFRNSDGESCTCVPQTLKFGFVKCSNTTRNSTKNKGPIITNCPKNTVVVSLDTKQNIGTIRNNFIAKDLEGKSLPVTISKTYVKSYQGNDNRQNQFLIEATTAEDIYGHRGRCEFVVEVKDESPPVFTHCPSTIYALPDERVWWSDPVAIDNVGIRTLVQLTYHNKKSIFPRGEHLISYIAYDWHGNNSKCQFFIIVENSLDNRDEYSL